MVYKPTYIRGAPSCRRTQVGQESLAGHCPAGLTKMKNETWIGLKMG